MILSRGASWFFCLQSADSPLPVILACVCSNLSDVFASAERSWCIKQGHSMSSVQTYHCLRLARTYNCFRNSEVQVRCFLSLIALRMPKCSSVDFTVQPQVAKAHQCKVSAQPISRRVQVLFWSQEGSKSVLQCQDLDCRCNSIGIPT